MTTQTEDTAEDTAALENRIQSLADDLATAVELGHLATALRKAALYKRARNGLMLAMAPLGHGSGQAWHSVADPPSRDEGRCQRGRDNGQPYSRDDYPMDAPPNYQPQSAGLVEEDSSRRDYDGDVATEKLIHDLRVLANTRHMSPWMRGRLHRSATALEEAAAEIERLQGEAARKVMLEAHERFRADAAEAEAARYREALVQILGWRELRSGRGTFPLARVEELARAALNPEPDHD